MHVYNTLSLYHPPALHLQPDCIKLHTIQQHSDKTSASLHTAVAVNEREDVKQTFNLKVKGDVQYK